METARIHWAWKAGAFIASVITLSWFFAGWRYISQDPGPAGFGLLAAATLLTIVLLTLQGYWIYFEEKEKGSLKKRIKLFEFIHGRLSHSNDSVDKDDKGEPGANG